MTAPVILRDFAGEERAFSLPIGRLRALQDKTDCGPVELLSRYMTHRWRVDDVREAIHQGLIGGGMEQAQASRLMRTDFDDLPKLQFVPLASDIVNSALESPPDEPLGEPEAGGQETNPSRDQSSVSASSTDSAQP